MTRIHSWLNRGFQKPFNTMLRMSLGTVVLAAFLAAGCRPQTQSIGEQVLQSFASGCRSSVGLWTQSALSQTQGLISAINNARSQENSACQGLNHALLAAQDIQAQLRLLAADPTQTDLRLKLETRSELLQALAEAEGAALVDNDRVLALRKRLYTAEISLAEAQAQTRAQSLVTEQDRLVRNLTIIHSQVRQLSDHANQLNSCLASSPQMGMLLVNALMAIGGSFAGPGWSAGMATLSSVIQSSLDLARQATWDQGWLEAQGVLLQNALTCGLETMTNLYCDAQSTHRLLDLAEQTQTETHYTATPLWRGLDLLSRRLPALTTWLGRIASGAEPPDPESAGRQNNIWNRYNSLQNLRRTIQGQLNRSRRLMDAATDPSVRENYSRRAFREVAATIANQGGVVLESFSLNQVICRLSGTLPCTPPLVGDPFDFLSQLPLVDGVPGLSQRTNSLIEMTSHTVTNELMREINIDPAMLLVEGSRPSLDNASPAQVLEQILSFFSEARDRFLHDPLPSRQMVLPLLDDTSAKLQRVHHLMTASTLQEAPQAVDSIFGEFRLLVGTQIIQERLSQLIRWDAELMLRQGRFPTELRQDLLGSTQGITYLLNRAGIASSDSASLRLDLNGAQSISQQNMFLFIRLFERQFRIALEQLNQAANQAGEPVQIDLNGRAPNRSRLSQLCLLIASSSPQWPSGIDQRLCQGTGLRASFSQAPELSLRFEDVANPRSPIPWRQKVCSYYRFLRSARVFRASWLRPPLAIP